MMSGKQIIELKCVSCKINALHFRSPVEKHWSKLHWTFIHVIYRLISPGNKIREDDIYPNC